MNELTVKCITAPRDLIIFGTVDKCREMVLEIHSYGEISEMHIGNVEAVSIINHLKEQFGL